MIQFTRMQAVAWPQAPKISGIISHLKTVEKFIPDSEEASIHGTVYLELPTSLPESHTFRERYLGLPGCRINQDAEGKTLYITTNYHIIKACQWDEDLNFSSKKISGHTKRYTVHLLSDYETALRLQGIPWLEVSIGDPENPIQTCVPQKIGQNKELITAVQERGGVNHVLTNLCQEISSGKELNELEWWLLAQSVSQQAYTQSLCKNPDWKPRERRSVLPLGTAVHSVISAFEGDWVKFFVKCGYEYDYNPTFPRIDVSEATFCIMEAFSAAHWDHPLDEAWEIYNG